jgi:hypothetical protein
MTTNNTDHNNKVDLSYVLGYVLVHAQPTRLAAAGLCQVLAFLLIINSSGFIYGGRETFIVLLMLAATILSSISLYRFLRPSHDATSQKG